MRKTTAVALVLMSALLALPVLARAADAPPAMADIVRGNPNVPNMQERIDYWGNAILDAKDDAALAKACQGLVGDYKAFDQKEAGYLFVEKAAAKLMAVLGKLPKDAMAKAKEVNIAMAVAQMPQVTSLAALDTLSTYPNPGARYYAWKGLTDARTRILAHGKASAEKALAAVDKAVKFETSQPAPAVQVMAQMFRMLALDDTRPSAVMDDVWALAQKQTFSTAQKNWRPWCLLVRGGDVELADAIRKVVTSLPAHAAWIGQGKGRTELLQMLTDAAWSAAKAYEEAKKANTPVEGLVNLLRDTEAALNKIQGTSRTFLEKPLSDAKATPDMVIWWVVDGEGNYGVQAWVDELKSQGVVKPQIEKPASAPAPAPASEPAK